MLIYKRKQRNRKMAGTLRFIKLAALLPFKLGNGVDFSLAALLGSARLDKLKLVPWFLYRLPEM